VKPVQITVVMMKQAEDQLDLPMGRSPQTQIDQIQGQMREPQVYGAQPIETKKMT
jgi:hypothetical protein